MKRIIDTKSLIRKQYEKRRAGTESLKVNLFKGYEVQALWVALAEVRSQFPNAGIDCIMAADSYINTHLG